MPKDFEIKYKFDTHIKKVLEMVHSGYQIDQHALNNVNYMLHDVATRLLRTAKSLNEATNTVTLSAREIQTAVTMTLPGELAKHALAVGTKALTKYTETPGGSRTQPVSRTERAGLKFPPSLVEAVMRSRGCTGRVGQGGPVYLAAVLEYLSAEVLELAGNAARDRMADLPGTPRVSVRDILIAVKVDEELSKLFNGVLNGGVIPS